MRLLTLRAAYPAHAALQVVTTNICGSDQHMVRGRTSLPGGHMVLGHEITGEVVELGDDCEMLEIGDICSVPFNIACGRCSACKRGDTGVCLTVNPARPGAAYGYVDMGGWIGGQSEYVMVPYADFNLLKFPDRAQALEKIKDLTLLSDIFPTGFHGAIQADVKPGATVYVAGAGPVGLAAAASCHLLGAACVIVGDMIPERLAQARSFGCETIDLRQDGSVKDHIAQILPHSDGWVDGAIDCVGFEARGSGSESSDEVPAQVLNDCMDIVREVRFLFMYRYIVRESCSQFDSLPLTSLTPSHLERHDVGRLDRDSRALRHRGPRRSRRGGADGEPLDADGPRLVQVALDAHRPVPGDEVPQELDERHPPRQDRHRRRRQRQVHLARRRPEWVLRLRHRRGGEVRHRPAQHDGLHCQRLSAASATARPPTARGCAAQEVRPKN
jgi:glutathione-independent formaldehyde dehydrogenase